MNGSWIIGLTVAKVSMTTAALSLAYTCLEVITEVAEAISITEAVEVVDTQYRTSYNCYSSRTDRSETKYTAEIKARQFVMYESRYVVSR